VKHATYFDSVVLISSLVYGLYGAYEVLAYYGVVGQAAIAGIFRNLWPQIVSSLVVWLALIFILVGQLRGKRWAFWSAVAVHIIVVILYGASLLVVGFIDRTSVIAAVMLLTNLIAAVALLLRIGTKVQETPSPPITFE